MDSPITKSRDISPAPLGSAVKPEKNAGLIMAVRIPPYVRVLISFWDSKTLTGYAAHHKKVVRLSQKLVTSQNPDLTVLSVHRRTIVVSPPRGVLKGFIYQSLTSSATSSASLSGDHPQSIEGTGYACEPWSMLSANFSRGRRSSRS